MPIYQKLFCDFKFLNEPYSFFRLNVMANIMKKPLKEIFSEFKIGDSLAETVQGSGDVKYHLGTSRDRQVGDHTVNRFEFPNFLSFPEKSNEFMFI
jgi:hypothetical protein